MTVPSLIKPAILTYKKTAWTLLRATGWVACASLVLAACCIFYYHRKAASYDLKIVSEMPSASSLYDCRGRLLHRFFEENRVLIPGGRVPELLGRAVVAAEDKRFYSHNGVDALGVARAAWANIRHAGCVQGGSTITQQLARNSIKRLERTLDRKMLEIFLAWRIERSYSKDEILFHYLNRIYFGRGLYGVETASQAFFGKTSAELSVGECAMLAGMISAPNAFSPWKDASAAKRSRHNVLGKMHAAGLVSAEQCAEAANAPLILMPIKVYEEDYFIDEVRKFLEDWMDDGQITGGGLKIFCSIDQEWQSWVRQKLSAISADGIGEKSDAAFCLLDSTSGEIRAMSGGDIYAARKPNIATLPQKCSAMLYPLLYAAAFSEMVCSPATFIESNPQFSDPAPGAENTHETEQLNSMPPRRRAWWTLHEFHGETAKSLRVRLGDDLWGKYRRNAGLEHLVSSVNIGTEASALDIAALYASFSNGGTWIRPTLILEVQDSGGRTLYRRSAEKRVLFSRETAYQVAMSLPFISPAPQQQEHKRFCVAKENLAQEGFWLGGFSSSHSAVLWLGSGKQGAATHNLLSEMLEKLPPATFEKPPALEAVLCDASGEGSPHQTIFLRPEQKDSSLPLQALSDAKQEKKRKRSFWEKIFGLN